MLLASHITRSHDVTDQKASDYRVATGCASRAARLFLRLAEMVRSMMAPQLIHFQA